METYIFKRGSLKSTTAKILQWSLQQKNFPKVFLMELSGYLEKRCFRTSAVVYFSFYCIMILRVFEEKNIPTTTLTYLCCCFYYLFAYKTYLLCCYISVFLDQKLKKLLHDFKKNISQQCPTLMKELSFRNSEELKGLAWLI